MKIFYSAHSKTIDYYSLHQYKQLLKQISIHIFESAEWKKFTQLTNYFRIIIHVKVQKIKSRVLIRTFLNQLTKKHFPVDSYIFRSLFVALIRNMFESAEKKVSSVNSILIWINTSCINCLDYRNES